MVRVAVHCGPVSARQFPVLQGLYRESHSPGAASRRRIDGNARISPQNSLRREQRLSQAGSAKDMAEYRILSNGEGFAEAVAAGHYSETSFSQLFDYCPEQLLTDDQRRRLDHLLFHVPRLHARRTKRQRKEAEELLALIAPVTQGSLVPEARELLLKRIAGIAIRASNRPKRPVLLLEPYEILLAKWIKQSVEACIKEQRPLNVAWWGPVTEEPAWSKLPLSERAIRIADKALRDRGLDLPSLATLRNRMSRISDLRHLIVNDCEEKQG